MSIGRCGKHNTSEMKAIDLTKKSEFTPNDAAVDRREEGELFVKPARLILWLLVFPLIFSFVIIPVHAQTPKRGGTLIIGTQQDPQGIDAHKDLAIQGIAIMPQIYDGLLNIDDEGNVVPGLAVSMPEQPDPVTYIFTLRKGVKFHNGADFDAQDVRFSFDRLTNKDISRHWKDAQDMIKSVEILDSYKVRITLHSPNVIFLETIGKMPETRIVPRGAPNEITFPIGTGPFKFKEWIKDDRLVLVRNENYWEKGLPYLDQIIYKPFTEPTTRVINLKTGKLDLVHNLPITDAVELKKDPRMKIIGRSGGETHQIWLNTTKPPFDNKKVRQAVAYGMDRKAVTDSVFMGFAEVAEDLFPSWHWAHNPNIKSYPYNPERAKALLKEAGYSAEKPLSFDLMCANEPVLTDQLVIIQAQLAKIGVKMNILAVDKSFRVDSMFGRKGRDYEALIAYSSDDMTDLQWTYRFFYSKSYYNHTGYNSERYGKKGPQNPEVDRLLGEMIRINDRNQARKMYDSIQKLLLDDMSLIKVCYAENIIGMRNYVKNHKVLTRNSIPLKRVWIDK